MNFIMIYLFLLLAFSNIFSLVKQLNKNQQEANKLVNTIQQIQKEEKQLFNMLNQQQQQEQIEKINKVLNKANMIIRDYVICYSTYNNFFIKNNQSEKYTNNDQLYNNNFKILLQLYNEINANNKKQYPSFERLDINLKSENKPLKIDFLLVEKLNKYINIIDEFHEQVVTERRNFLLSIKEILPDIVLPFNFPNINHENNIKEIYEQYIKNELIFFQGLFSNEHNFNNILNHFNI
jgi:hypothetical protein